MDCWGGKKNIYIYINLFIFSSNRLFRLDDRQEQRGILVNHLAIYVKGLQKPRGIRVDLGGLMHRSPRIFTGILDEIFIYNDNYDVFHLAFSHYFGTGKKINQVNKKN